MNEAWAELHRKFVSGVALSASEQEAYDAGCRELDDTEFLDGDIENARLLYAELTQMETERQTLLQEHERLRKQLDAAEARLDPSTRQKLGIGV